MTLYFPNLIWSVSTRTNQSMSLVHGDTKNSLENRKNFLSSLSIDYRDLVCANQVHGSLVSYVDESDRGRGALSNDTALQNSDALITNIRNLPIAVFTADCLSIFLYDRKQKGIGLIHAGWRSTKENISSKTVQLMQEKFKTIPKDLSVGFGPCLRLCCYEVGEEFSDYFEYGLTKRDNRYYLDLAGINKKQLLNLGVGEANIFDLANCTSCHNEEYFSYRREGSHSGRMISVIAIQLPRLP